MNLPVRTLTPEDADVMARTVIERTSTKGRVEYLGLQWKSDALLAWEIREREAGRKPKVHLRVDELDLEYVYIDIPDRGVGPFKAISRQPYFARGLSVFELNRLKKATSEKAINERLGRLADEEACQLRLEYYAELGHASDPVARQRLLDYMDRLAQKRLDQANRLLDTPDETPDGTNDSVGGEPDTTHVVEETSNSKPAKESETPYTSLPSETLNAEPQTEDSEAQSESEPQPQYRTLTVQRSHR